ncbi:MAG: transcriptional regulator [Rhizomicrobium sp.]
MNNGHRETHEIIVIGAFQLFPKERALKMDGAAIKLGGRAFDILLMLAEVPGEIVSQKELLANVWPNVFVEDVSLRVHISALRRVLEDQDKHQTYLMNVPGRGYKLIAPTSKHAVEVVRDPLLSPQLTLRLPRALQGMIGRQDEVQAISGKVLAQRFVNIVGPGGVGKNDCCTFGRAHAY